MTSRNDPAADGRLRVDAARIAERLEALSRIGRTPEGGVTRLAFTPEDRQATELVKRWMAEAGLDVRVDGVGNVFGRLPGGDERLPAVLSGSHLDTVRNGGKYDGAAGVVAALEAVRTIRRLGLKPKHPVEAAVFVNEEGSRFAGGLMGSLAMAGRLPKEALREWKDAEGVPLRDALLAFGADPDKLDAAACPPGKYKAFFELHIEQGEVLFREDVPVGIVSGIAGPYQAIVRLTGRSGHAGATPMRIRKDPMVAAAKIVLAVKDIAERTSPDTVGTVGFLQAIPGGHNVIPSEVRMTVDFRDTDPLRQQSLIAALRAAVAECCREDGIAFEIETTQLTPPVPIERGIVDAMRRHAERLGLPARLLPSGAAHDAMILAGLCPVGMIFVRSVGGLSHCPEEYSTSEDLALGAELLFRTIAEAAGCMDA